MQSLRISHEDIIKTLLTKVIALLPFYGWSKDAITKAAEELGIPMAANLYSVLDLFKIYMQSLSDQMIAQYEQTKDSSTSISKSIINCLKIKARLLSSDGQGAFLKTAAFLFSPKYALDNTKIIWQTCDTIWHVAVKDKSTDISYYTKRASLFLVYSSILLFMQSLDRHDKDYFEAIDNFIERQVTRLLKITKAKQKLNNLAKKLYS